MPNNKKKEQQFFLQQPTSHHRGQVKWRWNGLKTFLTLVVCTLSKKNIIICIVMF